MVRPHPVAACICVLSLPAARSFSLISNFDTSRAAFRRGTSTALSAGFGKPAGKRGGGGNENNKKKKKGSAFLDAGIEKTYGKSASAPLDVTIDVEAAMNAFFGTNEEFAPLFRCMATSNTAPAMDFLAGDEPHGTPITFGPDTPLSLIHI